MNVINRWEVVKMGRGWKKFPRDLFNLMARRKRTNVSLEVYFIIRSVTYFNATINP